MIDRTGEIWQVFDSPHAKVPKVIFVVLSSLDDFYHRAQILYPKCSEQLYFESPDQVWEESVYAKRIIT